MTGEDHTGRSAHSGDADRTEHGEHRGSTSPDDAPRHEEEAQRMRRASLILAGTVAALLLLATLAVVLAVTRTPEQLPTGTPEARVQAYLQAVVEGDHEAAVQHLDPERGCTAADLTGVHVGSDQRIVLRDTSIDGDRARVEVDIVHGSPGPLAGSEWTDEQVFHLDQVGSDWLITGAPWPFFSCEAKEQDR